MSRIKVIIFCLIETAAALVIERALKHRTRGLHYCFAGIQRAAFNIHKMENCNKLSSVVRPVTPSAIWRAGTCSWWISFTHLL